MNIINKKIIVIITSLEIIKNTLFKYINALI